MSKPGYVTPYDLLLTAAEALENWPESSTSYDRKEQHPEDAWSVAETILATVAAVKIAEHQATRQ